MVTEFGTSPTAAQIMYSLMLNKAELQTFRSSLEVGEFQSHCKLLHNWRYLPLLQKKKKKNVQTREGNSHKTGYVRQTTSAPTRWLMCNQSKCHLSGTPFTPVAMAMSFHTVTEINLWLVSEGSDGGLFLALTRSLVVVVVFLFHSVDHRPPPCVAPGFSK